MSTVLAQLADLPADGCAEAQLGEDSVVLIRHAGGVHAYLNICPHAGRPLNWAPGRFLYAHGQLVCAAHGAAFQPEDGLCIGGPCRGSALTAVPVELRDGQVIAV